MCLFPARIFLNTSAVVILKIISPHCVNQICYSEYSYFAQLVCIEGKKESLGVQVIAQPSCWTWHAFLLLFSPGQPIYTTKNERGALWEKVENMEKTLRIQQR
jgi:hypothetical protein